MSSGCRCGSTSTFLHTLLVSVVSRSRIPSCLWATNPPFLHERPWPTVNLSPRAQWLGRPNRGRFYRSLSESLNSCLFIARPCSSRANALSHELAPLSLDWFTNCSRSREREASIFYIFDFANAILSEWWCFFNSSMDCPLVTISVLCVVIDSTWDDVIEVGVVYCRGASDLKIWYTQAPLHVLVTRWLAHVARREAVPFVQIVLAEAGHQLSHE